jgi:cytochrome c oxidase cbb3-type subunit 4
MANMYAFLASLAQQVGILAFMTAFGMVCAYALWPRNRATFDHAANTPFREDDAP